MEDLCAVGRQHKAQLITAREGRLGGMCGTGDVTKISPDFVLINAKRFNRDKICPSGMARPKLQLMPCRLRLGPISQRSSDFIFYIALS